MTKIAIGVGASPVTKNTTVLGRGLTCSESNTAAVRLNDGTVIEFPTTGPAAVNGRTVEIPTTEGRRRFVTADRETWHEVRA